MWAIQTISWTWKGPAAKPQDIHWQLRRRELWRQESLCRMSTPESSLSCLVNEQKDEKREPVIKERKPAHICQRLPLLVKEWILGAFSSGETHGICVIYMLKFPTNHSADNDFHVPNSCDAALKVNEEICLKGNAKCPGFTEKFTCFSCKLSRSCWNEFVQKSEPLRKRETIVVYVCNVVLLVGLPVRAHWTYLWSY